MPDNKIVNKTITINAPATKVWDTLTTPALMREWLFDSPIEVTTDWQIGSLMVFSGTFLDRPFKDKGTVLQFDPGKTLEYKYWSSLSRLPDRPENYMLTRFELTPVEN